MGQGAQLFFIGILAKLRVALTCFDSEVNGLLLLADREIQENLDWINQRQIYWYKEYERCQRELLIAQKLLEKCLSGMKENNRGVGICAHEERLVKEAKQAMKQAHNEFETARHWHRALNQSFECYRTKIHKYKNESEKAISKGKSILQKKVEILSKYSDSNSHWSTLDGTIVHGILGQVAQDSIEDADADIIVTPEWKIRINSNEGQKIGRTDLCVDHNGNTTIVDFKTDDMSKWTLSCSFARGKEYGDQIRQYLDSPDITDGAKGYIIAAGKLPQSEEVVNAFKEGLGDRVEVIFCTGSEKPGIISDTLAAIRQAIYLTEKGNCL